METARVEIEKVAEFFPAATFTLPGTLAKLKWLVRLTDMPPVGASPESFTVPTELNVPVTEFGLIANETRLGGTNETVVDLTVFPAVAVMLTTTAFGTGDVVTLKVFED